MNKQVTLTEEQVRQLRDQVFERPSTDHGWEACKECWLQPANVAWLKAEWAKIQPMPQRP